MPETIKRLAYFKERSDDEQVSRIPPARPDLATVQLQLDRDRENWDELGRAHGYQVLTRSESTFSPTAAQFLADAALIARCPNLLAVSAAGAGYDVIDVDACTAAGVIVVNQSGAGKEAVAEHAFGFMIALSKKIGLADRVIRRPGKWDRMALQGNDLLGKTLGVVGFGQIGSRLAELCSVFKMTILAYDPYLSEKQVAERGGVKVELDELLQRSDFVSLNGPLSDETAGMFGERQFARMKRGAFFVTTARGGVHDEKALVAALASGQLGGAGIDVFHQEPPPHDHPLFAFDNVLVSPHTAGITVETNRSIARACAAQWLQIFDAQVPPRLINPAAWPRYTERYEKLLGRRPPKLP
jgi:D-3-phosphoglycerate dehydrogenase